MDKSDVSGSVPIYTRQLTPLVAVGQMASVEVVVFFHSLPA